MKPIAERQLRVVHHRTASECCSVTAVFALVLLLALQPYYVVRAAMLARHAFLVSHFLKLATAGRFVREILVELKNLHVTAIL